MSWFPKETRVVQLWVPAWSSPSLPGVSTGIVSFWGPRGEQEQALHEGPPARQGCSRNLTLAHHARIARDASSPPPSPWFGEQEAAEGNVRWDFASIAAMEGLWGRGVVVTGV